MANTCPPVYSSTRPTRAPGAPSLPHAQSLGALNRCNRIDLPQACGFPSSAAPHGLYKEYERTRHLRTLALRAEQRAREELLQKQRRRWWKRQLLGGVFALCGVALALLPALLMLLRKDEGPGTGKAAAGQRVPSAGGAAHGAPPPLPPPPKELR